MNTLWLLPVLGIITFRPGTVPEDEEEGGRAGGEMINNQLFQVTGRAGQGRAAGITSFSAPTSCRVLLRGPGAGWVVGGHGSHIGTTSLLFDTSAGHPVWRVVGVTGGQHDTGLHCTGTLFFLYFQKPDIDFSV